MREITQSEQGVTRSSSRFPHCFSCQASPSWYHPLAFLLPTPPFKTFPTLLFSPSLPLSPPPTSLSPFSSFASFFIVVFAFSLSLFQPHFIFLPSLPKLDQLPFVSFALAFRLFFYLLRRSRPWEMSGWTHSQLNNSKSLFWFEHDSCWNLSVIFLIRWTIFQIDSGWLLLKTTHLDKKISKLGSKWIQNWGTNVAVHVQGIRRSINSNVKRG